MAATLYLVRHGRTVFNERGLLQGWCDSPLTPAGLEGVRRTGRDLGDRDFVAAYASPSGRAVATAREILRAHPGVGLTLDDGLREFGYGDWEARPEHELWSTVEPRDLYREVFRGVHPGLPGGESSVAYLARVRRSFARIESHQGSVLVVSHGGTLQGYLGAVRGAEVALPPNAGVSVVDVDDRGRRRLRAGGLGAAG